MRILFLHGWHSIVGGVKPTFLKSAGHEVVNPPLDDDDFELAVATAQRAFDESSPHVVVGSSRGGAVALKNEAESFASKKPPKSQTVMICCQELCVSDENPAVAGELRSKVTIIPAGQMAVKHCLV